MTTPTQSPSDERANLPSASSMERLVFCPGSWKAEEQFPQDEASEIAARGTAIHKALETGEDEGLELSDEIVAGKLRAVEEEAIAAWLAEMQLPGGRVIREERLWFRDSKTLEPLASAKVDCACIAGDHALIIDAKSGFLDTTPAELNWQLRTQVVALNNEYPEVRYIRAAISSGRGNAKYDAVDYAWDDIEISRLTLRAYIDVALEKDQPRVPGSWCRYCRARGSCPQAAAFALLPIPISGAMDKAAVVDKVALLAPAALAEIHARKTLVVAILDAVDDRLKGMLAQELAAVGLELVPNSPMRKITDIRKAHELLVTPNVISSDEFLDLCSLSITALEKLAVGKLAKAAKISKEDAKKELKDLIAPAVTLTPKSPSLKPCRIVTVQIPG